MPRFERKHLQTPLKTKIKATQQVERVCHVCIYTHTVMFCGNAIYQSAGAVLQTLTSFLTFQLMSAG